MRPNQIDLCVHAMADFEMFRRFSYPRLWLLLLVIPLAERGHPKSPGLNGDYRTFKPIPAVLFNFHFYRRLAHTTCPAILSSSLMSQWVDAATVIPSLAHPISIEQKTENAL